MHDTLVDALSVTVQVTVCRVSEIPNKEPLGGLQAKPYDVMPPEAEMGYSTVVPVSPDAVTSKSGHVMESGSEKVHKSFRREITKLSVLKDKLNN